MPSLLRLSSLRSLRSRPHPARTGSCLAARIHQLLRVGAVSRAARGITDQAAVAPDDAVHAALQALHPDEPPPDLPLQATPAAVLRREHLDAVMQRLPRGKAAGPSGWTYEHIRAVVSASDASAAAVQAFLNLLLSGAFPHCPELLAARLIPLRKPNGGVRPIAIGEVWFRLAGICAMEACPGASRMLAPLQLGVGVAGGAQCMGHAVAHALRTDPSAVALKVDWENAFNTVHRSAVLRAVANRAPSLLPFAAWSYGQHSDLHVAGEQPDRPFLRSRSGVKQGDPCGMLFFALALQPVLEAVAQQHPGVAIIAYADDVVLVGTPEGVHAAYAALTDGAADIGLRARPDKSQIFSPATDVTTVAGCLGVQKPAGIVVAGTPVGPTDFVRAHVQDLLQDALQAVQALHALPLPHQDKHALLSKSLQHCLTHLPRTIPAADVADALRTHSAAIRQCLGDILDLPEGQDARADAQIQLPRRHGGMGYHKPSETWCHAAYCSTVAHARTALQGGHERFHMAAPPQTSPLHVAWAALRAAVGDALGLPDDFAATLRPGAPLHGTDLQSVVGKHLDEAAAKALLEDTDGLEEGAALQHQARLRSCSCPQASAWLDALPVHASLTLSDYEFRSAGRFRLGQSTLAAALVPGRCDCGQDLTPSHVMGCRKLAEQTRERHDSLVGAWRRILRRAGVATTVEAPLHLLQNRRRRMDNPDGRGDICAILDMQEVLDVSVAHPATAATCASSRSDLRRCAHTDGSAAHDRDVLKRNKYRRNGCVEVFRPLSHETYGRLGKPAQALLCQLGDMAAGCGGTTKAAFVQGAVRELSTTLCKGNHLVFRKFSFNLAKVSGSAYEPGLMLPTDALE